MLRTKRKYFLLFLVIMTFFAGLFAYEMKREDMTVRLDFDDVVATPVVSSVHTEAQTLRVAISSVLSPRESVVYYRAIANELGRRLGRPVILIQRQNYAEIGLLLLNGGADIAFFSSGEYATYSAFNEIEMLVGQERQGLPYYQGYLLVAKDSAINKIDDLRGKSVAFTDPLSYSGFIFFDDILRKKNETPESFLGRHIYTYSHDKSLRAVANKVVDAAPVTSLIYEHAKLKTPELAEAVRIIAVSPPAGIGPVVVGRSVSAAQRVILREAFLNMHKNPATIPALQGLMIDRFVLPNPDLYENSRRMAQEKRTK